MIVIIGRVEIDPQALPAMKAAMAAMMEATRGEPGCLYYSMAIEDAAAGILTLAERWQDDAALEAHFATPHMKAFMGAAEGAIRAMDARRYDATGERPLSL